MALLLLQIALGIALLVLGAEVLVRGAVDVARRLGLSPLVIGVVLVGFGTSVPELATSLQAVAADVPGLAVGNIVGSNIANILLILGAGALLATIPTDRETLLRDGGVLLVVSVLLTLVALWGRMVWWHGVGLMALLAAYIVWSLRRPSGQAPEEDDDDGADGPPLSAPRGIALTLGGCLIAVLGADVLVDGGVDVARAIGVSETIIGLTVGAIGTSLPELVAVGAAALRQHGDIALGSIIGSNLYNTCAILGLTSLIETLEFPPDIIRTDVVVMLCATVLLLGMAWTDQRISRPEGGVLLASYGVYLWSVVPL